jgi:sec-independent protein translocase protein TatC
MPDIELPLTGHLEELRRRLFRALLAIAVTFTVCYPNAEWLFTLLTYPLTSAAAASKQPVELIGTGVAEAFFTRLAVSFVGAVFLALPVILYQLWRFVLPGLNDREVQYGRGFVVAGTVFFLLGAAFCYLVALPVGFPFFLSEYERIGVTPNIRINEYLAFTSRTLLAFGVIFEMPVATFFLARVGIVSHHFLLRYVRHAIVVVFVVAAILTPPDAVSQMIMAIPLLILYGLSIGVAYVFYRPRMAEEPEPPEADESSSQALASPSNKSE